MRPIPSLVACLLLTTIGAPFASAGTMEDPELSDAEGDCAFAPGNEYMDIVAAWVSDETAADFTVNMAIAKWSNEAGGGAAFTVQFTHQGVQFGVVAAYQGPDGWYYGNARVDSNGVNEMVETRGSFSAGTPSVLSIVFLKSHFPHTDATDTKLRSFTAGSADLKPALPFLITGQQTPLPLTDMMIACDDASGTGEYEFAVGDHAQHGAGDNMGDMPSDDTTQAPPPSEPVAAQNAPTNETPAPGLALALVAALLALVVLRKKRRA